MSAPTSKVKILTALKKLRNGHIKGCSRQAIKAEISKNFGSEIPRYVFWKAMKNAIEIGLVKPGSTSSRFKLTKEGYNFLATQKVKKISKNGKKTIMLKRHKNYRISVAGTKSKLKIWASTKSSKNGKSITCPSRTVKAAIVKSAEKDIATHVFKRVLRNTMQHGMGKAGDARIRFEVTVKGFASLTSTKKRKSPKKLASKITRSARAPSSKLKILIAMKKMRNGHIKGCSRQAIKREVANSSGKVIATHIFRRAMKVSMESGLVKAGSTSSRFKLTSEGYAYITSSMPKKKRTSRVLRKEKKTKAGKRSMKKVKPEKA